MGPVALRDGTSGVRRPWGLPVHFVNVVRGSGGRVPKVMKV
ncbi:hypothetical protein [Nonomuraea sp. NPDC002799]